ncbi:cytochrome B561 [Methylobacterium variabile]|jgi:cytochrome b561|uniref:Cytochrome B561 n=1 Tax=Methylobacterium variabile TaxID=298794 RepID=A0A0J6TC68_9HYPH|nr:cytochrome b [Methylobacterium variabile]KMO43454.1 cytochrome B561 [Methylobacterium variabile]
MRTVATPRRYTLVAIGLHWLIALGILALLGIGLAMTRGSLPPMERFALYQWHKSVGLTVLVLMAIRLAWRLFHRPPPLPETMPKAERRAAGAAHLALYGLLVAMPLVGWAMVSASPYNIPTVLYGVIPWPHLPVLPELPNKAAVEGALKLAHSYGAWLLIALLLLHIGAALRHHLVLRDDTLWRMLPVVPRPGAKSEASSR